MLVPVRIAPLVLAHCESGPRPSSFDTESAGPPDPGRRYRPMIEALRPPALPEVSFVRASSDEPNAVRLAAAYVREANDLYADSPLPPAPPLAELLTPGDRLLVAYVGGAPVACGAVRLLGPGVGEVKRMFILPDWRRRGMGRQLLAELEREAVSIGCSRVRLDTGDRQTAALTLYRSSGYREIADYNGNTGATHWFEKKLPR
jgi:GNAT superfamily N-acetyltransferase